MTITGDGLYELLPGALRTRRRRGRRDGPRAARGARRAARRGRRRHRADGRRLVHRDLRAVGRPVRRRAASASTCSPRSRASRRPRARIANTIGYRRRKGTSRCSRRSRATRPAGRRVRSSTSALLAPTSTSPTSGSTGPRASRCATATRSSWSAAPFDSAPHTVDVRRIAATAAQPARRHNIPNIGLHVYRLGASGCRGRRRRRPPTRPTAATSSTRSGATSRCSTVPRRRRRSTTWRPRPTCPPRCAGVRCTTSSNGGATTSPTAASRARAGSATGRRCACTGALNAGDRLLEVPPEQLEVCHLGDLGGPPGGAGRRPGACRSTRCSGASRSPPARCPPRCCVSAAHGFAGDVGAGPVRPHAPRSRSGSTGPSPGTSASAATSTPAPNVIFPTLGEAIGAWNAQPDGTVGLIAVMDSHRFDEDLTGANRVTVGEGSSLRDRGRRLAGAARARRRCPASWRAAPADPPGRRPAGAAPDARGGRGRRRTTARPPATVADRRPADRRAACSSPPAARATSAA